MDIILACEESQTVTKEFRKPDQIVHPYFFGDLYEKGTCLWLKGLPLLYHNPTPNLFDSVQTHVQPEERLVWQKQCQHNGHKYNL